MKKDIVQRIVSNIVIAIGLVTWWLLDGPFWVLIVFLSGWAAIRFWWAFRNLNR